MWKQLVTSQQPGNRGRKGLDMVSPSKACLGNLLSSTRIHRPKFLPVSKMAPGAKHLIGEPVVDILYSRYSTTSPSQPPTSDWFSISQQPLPQLCASLPQRTLTMPVPAPSWKIRLLPLCPSSPMHPLGKLPLLHRVAFGWG